MIEATGKWHRQVHRSLHAGGYKVRIVNPLRARLFAEGMGLLGKTDRLDARMLATFAEVLGNAAKPPAPEVIEELQELVQARVSGVEEQTCLANQLKSAQTVFLRRQLKRRLMRIAGDIKAIEAELLTRVKADETLTRRYAILLSIPSFGPVAKPQLTENALRHDQPPPNLRNH